MTDSTDTIHVSGYTDLVKFRQMLSKRFGGGDCIERCVKIDGKQQARVVFNDVRDVDKALQILGESRSERATPSKIDRLVQLPGDVELDPAHVGCVEQIFHGQNDRSYAVKFFDERVAKIYRDGAVGGGGAGKGSAALHKAATSKGPSLPPGLEPPPGLEAPSRRTAAVPAASHKAIKKAAGTTPRAQKGPKHVAAVEQGWKPTLRPAHHPVVVGVQVEITGIPNDICSNAMIPAVFDQAGLERDVASFSVQKGKASGKLLVHLTSMDAAKKCKAHFHNCLWTGCAVSAQILPCSGPGEVAFAANAAQVPPAAAVHAQAQAMYKLAAAAAYQEQHAAAMMAHIQAAQAAKEQAILSQRQALSSQAPSFVPHVPPPRKPDHELGGAALFAKPGKATPAFDLGTKQQQQLQAADDDKGPTKPDGTAAEIRARISSSASTELGTERCSDGGDSSGEETIVAAARAIGGPRQCVSAQ